MTFYYWSQSFLHAWQYGKRMRHWTSNNEKAQPTGDFTLGGKPDTSLLLKVRVEHLESAGKFRVSLIEIHIGN